MAVYLLRPVLRQVSETYRAVTPIVTATNTVGRVITVPGAVLGQMAIVP
jgi:hypothetical protein